jgi:hypothetical protein
MQSNGVEPANKNEYAIKCVYKIFSTAFFRKAMLLFIDLSKWPDVLQPQRI